MLDPFDQGELTFEGFQEQAAECRMLAREVRDFSNDAVLNEVLQVVSAIQERVIELAKLFRDAHPTGAADLHGVVSLLTPLPSDMACPWLMLQ
jgi:hypothetical protein